VRRIVRDLSFILAIGVMTITPLNLLSQAAYGHPCRPWWLTQLATLVALLWTAHRLDRSRR
jgi:hypothetical protein